MKKQIILIFGVVVLVVASWADADEPVVYRDQTLTLPHGLVVADDGLHFYQDIRLEEQGDGSFRVAAAEEGVLAMVDSVDVLPGDDDSVRDVVVQGHLSTPCDVLMEPMIQRDGMLFGIVLAQRNTLQANQACAQVLDPFEEVIELDVSDLEPGQYTVNVNGTEAVFTR